MSTRGHELEEAHRRFAALHSCSLRTAQRNSKQRSGKWLEFLEKGVVMTVGKTSEDRGAAEEVVLPPAPESVNKAVGEMTPEEWAEAETWKLLRANAQRAQTCVDPLERSAAMRHHAELIGKWQGARRHRQLSEERARKVVPIEEFYLVKGIVARVAGLIAALPELAPMLNRANPMEARQGLMTWLENQFNPAVKNVEAECNQRLASAA